MLLEKIIPQSSGTYLSMKVIFDKIGKKIDNFGLIQLFTIWTLTVSGIVIDMGLINRSVYWDWSNWLIGLSKLFFVMIIFLFFLKPNGLWDVDKKRLEFSSIGIHLVIAFLCIFIGLYNSNISLNHLLLTFLYLIFFFGGLLIFQFQIKLNKEKKIWFITNFDNKVLILSLSLFLMILSAIIGVYLDDPIISTSAIVSTPFPLIALIWPNHVRHLQRARFYPLFIFAMFLCVRAPWFLIPLLILFFFLRIVNYLRFGITHPSFGVDFSEED
tara:strand:- start:678 stop:1490 length:813 start_codon:yes stop_codon:yes gene_type:complete